jgi:hypothetical protein
MSTDLGVNIINTFLETGMKSTLTLDSYKKKLPHNSIFSDLVNKDDKPSKQLVDHIQNVVKNIRTYAVDGGFLDYSVYANIDTNMR